MYESERQKAMYLLKEIEMLESELRDIASGIDDSIPWKVVLRTKLKLVI